MHKKNNKSKVTLWSYHVT